MNPLAGVLSEAWAMYRAHARHLMTIAFTVYVVAALVEVAFGALGPVGRLLAAIVSIVAAFLLQAALVKAVEDLRDGRADLTLGETLQAARPFIGQVAIASLLAGLGIAIGVVLLVVPGLILLTIWAVFAPVIVLEGAGGATSLQRSRDLVKGHAWQVFGTLVVVFLLLLATAAAIGLALSPLPEPLGQAISSIVSGTVVGPFLSVVVTLVYFRLRTAANAGGLGYHEPGYPSVG